MSKIYNKRIYKFTAFTALLFSLGCNVINPAETVPTYIHIDSFQFEEADLEDINCAWVYYNNNPIGAFDLPATIPVPATGSGKLEIKPGIAVNGRNERPLVYPFYTFDEYTFAAQPGKIITHIPKTKYFSTIKTYNISDFEAGITKFGKFSGTVGIVAITDSRKYEGTGSGAIILSSPADSSIDSTITSFPISHGAAFIEFVYKSDIPFALGMKAYSNGYTHQEYKAGVGASPTWRKFYFNVTGFVSDYPADKYDLFIKATLSSGQTQGQLLIDNIKLITF